jgi:hypothetical protein
MDMPRIPGAFPVSDSTISTTVHLAEDSPRSLNAPLRLLPAELLGRIFMSCIDERFPLPCIASAPLLLCRIDRSCRQVALSTPSLWSSIRVQLPPKISMECMTAGVQTWLNRSGALPLSIRIDSHPIYPIPDDFFSIFIPSFPRWSHLKWHIPRTSLVHILNHPEAWAQLTRFTLSSDCSVNDSLEILSRCPKLQQASFLRIFQPSDFAAHPNGTIVLPDLHTLKIFTKDDIYPLFDSLELPALRNFEVHFYWLQAWEKLRLLSLFERSLCPIERLVLEGQAIPEPDLVDCVERMLELRTLIAVYGGKSLVTTKVADVLGRRISSYRTTESVT